MQNRRSFFQSAMTALASLPVLGAAAVAYAKTVVVTLVDPKSAVAKGLKYVEASAVKGKNCSNCIQYREETTHAGKKVGLCNIFPTKYVTAKGHCSVWALNPTAAKKPAVKKPATKK